MEREERKEHHSHPAGRENTQGDDQGGGRFRRKFFRKKVCRLCHNNKDRFHYDYKHAEDLKRFITDGGKLLPRRITGTCAKHQRHIAREIKRARFLALLPYVLR